MTHQNQDPTSELTTADSIRDRIVSSRKSAERHRSSAFREWAIGAFTVGIVSGATSYAALRGIDPAWVPLFAAESGLVVATGGAYAALAHRNTQEAKSYDERAAALEGALAQHELATNTVLFEQPQTAASAIAQVHPETSH